MKKFIIALVVTCMTQGVWANLKTDIQDLDNRLFDLEEKLQGKFPVSPIDARKLRIGGVLYHDQRYAVSNADGYKNSLISSTRMDMFLAGDVDDNIDYLFVPVWYFQSARSNPDAANRAATGKRQTMTLVSRLFINYKLNGNHKITIGRFMAPFSSYVDTYSLNADKLSMRPQMVSPLGIVFAPIVDGLMYTGQSFFSHLSFRYKIYAAIHSTDGGAMADNPFQKYLFNGTPSKHRYGFRTIIGFFNNKINWGLSGQFGERFYGASTTISPVFGKIAAFGTDININFGKFKIKAEFVKTNEEKIADTTFPTVSSTIDFATSTNTRNFIAQYLDSNKESYYLEATYQINSKLMFAARYDYIDFKTKLFAQGKAKKVIETTINYFPIEKLMLKFSIDKHNYDATATDIANNPIFATNMPQMSGGVADAQADPDYIEYSISATLSF